MRLSIARLVLVTILIFSFAFPLGPFLSFLQTYRTSHLGRVQHKSCSRCFVQGAPPPPLEVVPTARTSPKTIDQDSRSNRPVGCGNHIILSGGAWTPESDQLATEPFIHQPEEGRKVFHVRPTRKKYSNHVHIPPQGVQLWRRRPAKRPLPNARVAPAPTAGKTFAAWIWSWQPP